MILTTEAGDKYKLHFRHWHNPEFESKQRALHPPKKVWIGMSGKKDALNTTSCAVHLGECATKDRPCNTTGTEFGHAECSVLDTFDRAEGRRRSPGEDGEVLVTSRDAGTAVRKTNLPVPVCAR